MAAAAAMPPPCRHFAVADFRFRHFRFITLPRLSIFRCHDLLLSIVTLFMLLLLSRLPPLLPPIFGAYADVVYFRYATAHLYAIDLLLPPCCRLRCYAGGIRVTYDMPYADYFRHYMPLCRFCCFISFFQLRRYSRC